MSKPVQAAAFDRLQQLMSSSPVPSISTELLTTADGDLNRELNSFLFDPPSDPELLKGKRIAICCTNGVEEVEILGAHRWLSEHGAAVHIVSPRIGEFDPTLGLRFPPQCTTHVLAIRLMENAGWLKIDRYTDEAQAADYDAILLPGGCWNRGWNASCWTPPSFTPCRRTTALRAGRRSTRSCCRTTGKWRP